MFSCRSCKLSWYSPVPIISRAPDLRKRPIHDSITFYCTSVQYFSKSPDVVEMLRAPRWRSPATKFRRYRVARKAVERRASSSTPHAITTNLAPSGTIHFCKNTVSFPCTSLPYWDPLLSLSVRHNNEMCLGGDYTKRCMHRWTITRVCISRDTKKTISESWVIMYESPRVSVSPDNKIYRGVCVYPSCNSVHAPRFAFRETFQAGGGNRQVLVEMNEEQQ